MKAHRQQAIERWVEFAVESMPPTLAEVARNQGPIFHIRYAIRIVVKLHARQASRTEVWFVENHSTPSKVEVPLGL